jgi:putative intracellular protease/amidase
MAASKPVAVCGRALQLMIFADQVQGMTVCGPDDVEESVVRAGGRWSGELRVVHKNLLTGKTEEHRGDFVKAMVEHFTDYARSMPRAA